MAAREMGLEAVCLQSLVDIQELVVRNETALYEYLEMHKTNLAEKVQSYSFC